MAGLITKIKRIFNPQQEPRCPACKRTLQQAVDEQLKSQKGCPLEHCAFKEEIKQAILESKMSEVILWNVDKTQILENENITLSWEVLYAKKITISELGEVPLKDNRTIALRRDTTYTLTIQDYKDNIYETEQSINITVIPLPIVEIREENFKIERGDTVMLHWNVNNVSKIILAFDNQVIDVTNLTEFAIQPNEHITYKLTFTALDHKTTIEKEIGIEIFPKPEIKLFEVLPDVVISSMPVTISWRVENAKKIEINNGVGEVNEVGQKTILHDKNTLYQLTAWGELSFVTKEIVITVFPTPIIKSLLIPIPDFESHINLSTIKIEPPKIDVALNIPEFDLESPEINLNLPDFNWETPKFIEPSGDFIKLYKSQISIFNFLKSRKIS